MDQKRLRELENQCIQEQPPECLAACPIHVDARALAGHIAKEQWNEALKTLRRTMPFPGILGCICDGPCLERCKRGQAGDPIRINELERTCVLRPASRQIVQALPAKSKSVAILGGGLSGLTVAWDLARKGYNVTIFEAGVRLGGDLARRFPDRLSDESIQAEVEILHRLGVKVNLDTDLDSSVFPDQCLTDFDAVYLSFESAEFKTWSLNRDDAGTVAITPILQTTSHDRVFAGGRSESPVWQAAEGRWAATTMDRYLQNVSPTAGREKDGPFKTRLFTSLEGVVPRPAAPMADADRGYTEAEAVEEARRCIQCECMECVKVCAYLERFGGYPKKYAREIYNNESIVMGTRLANKLIDSCSLCGLCQEVCPEDFAMQDLCLVSRQGMVERGKMPPSAHEFALLDMEFSRSDRFAMARHEPGRESSAYLFFPGCQLAASAPDQAFRVYEHLRKTLPGGVGLMLDCCGAPAHWAGRVNLHREVIDHWREKWVELGRPRLIPACSTCYRQLEENLPEVDKISLWQVLEETGVPEHSRPSSGALTVHDPCTTRREPEIRQAVRQLLTQSGISLWELKLSHEKTECCGFGGLMQNANPDMAREVAARRARTSELDYVAYCAMCRDNLAAVGKRTIHILDILFPRPGDSDPAAWPRLDWSERRENRERLKTRLLKDIWGEEQVLMEPYQMIKLILSPEVRETLDRRRIFSEDVQQVISHAEETGDRLLNPETGRFKAFFRPFHVTFWVEYSPTEDGYIVHNAYAHRMEVLEGGRS